ncbi:MAG: hypothetical protein ACRD00_08605 [Thermoanaerobaculia bacterium]
MLTEACVLRAHRVQRQRLRRFLAEFEVTPYTSEDEARLWSDVFEWLVRSQEHDPEADAYLAVVPARGR